MTTSQLWSAVNDKKDVPKPKSVSDGNNIGQHYIYHSPSFFTIILSFSSCSLPSDTWGFVLLRQFIFCVAYCLRYLFFLLFFSFVFFFFLLTCDALWCRQTVSWVACCLLRSFFFRLCCLDHSEAPPRASLPDPLTRAALSSLSRPGRRGRCFPSCSSPQSSRRVVDSLPIKGDEGLG